MIYVMNDELYHHGIKGQKWGIRRYQNADGSLTEAGQKRYSSSAGGAARRALAKVYDINEKFYSKNGRNKTLASMNAAARDELLKKADEADKAKAEKRAAANKLNAEKRAAKSAQKSDPNDKKKLNVGKAAALTALALSGAYAYNTLMKQYGDKPFPDIAGRPVNDWIENSFSYKTIKKIDHKVNDKYYPFLNDPNRWNIPDYE